jgi:hypothetical protein
MPRPDESVRVLTEENWRRAWRTRRSAGVYMSVHIEELPDRRYQTIYGYPPRYGALQQWDTLAQALDYANRDSGGTHIFFGGVPPGAPARETYDPETDTTVIDVPDFGPEHLVSDEEDE